jgi:glycogen synthase
MTNKQKLDLLNKLQEIDKIPAVNSGGCAIVAYAIKKYLKKKGIKSKIIYLLDYSDDYENIKNGNPESCAHAVISIKNTWYDSRGKLSKKPIIREYAQAGLLPVKSSLTKSLFNTLVGIVDLTEKKPYLK